MNIPTDIPLSINFNFHNPISKSVIYTFTSNDIYLDNENNILYRFPYSKNTYWTNFKYSCYNTTNNQFEELDIGIELRTSDGYKYTIKASEVLKNKEWYNTVWPIPSIYTYGTDASIDFKIKPLSDNKSTYNIVISLLGFMDLYPNVKNYLLCSSLNTYQFIFNKIEQDDSNNMYGSIYNVEHYDYIRDIINNACIIRLITIY
jgi:hypothetical protein